MTKHVSVTGIKSTKMLICLSSLFFISKCCATESSAHNWDLMRGNTGKKATKIVKGLTCQNEDLDLICV